MKNIKCIFCNFKTKKVKHSLPSFDHFGFNTISKKIFFRKCLKCSLIFNPKKVKNNFFYNEKYVKSNTDHILLKKRNKNVTRNSVTSEIIKKILLKRKDLKILEVGCADGDLVKKLNEKLSNTSFFGIEMSKHSKKLFPQKKNFTLFIKPNLKKLNEKFDLIILSHVFKYFKNPKETLTQFHRLLKPKGKLFIVAHNIKKNPYYSLMGDQKVILTPDSFDNILKISGFVTKKINNQYLKRELVLVSNKSNSKKFSLKKDNTFERNIKIIIKKKNSLINKKIKKPIIFGTNINAACIDEFFGSKALFFVDEHCGKYKKSFRGKRIIHPKQLAKNSKIIFSMYKNGQLIKKLQNKYKKQFFIY